MKTVIACADLFQPDAAHQAVWQTLWNRTGIGRIALSVQPEEERLARLKEADAFDLNESGYKPANWKPSWRDALVAGLYQFLAETELPGDGFPALEVPRFVHSQSQGITDLFGARVEEQADGHCYTHPLPPDPVVINALEPRPLQTSVYWNAIEWVKYARAATGGYLPFHNPVMTGPLDTANYLLGTTILLDWVYTEPETVHRLLDKITNVLTGMMGAFIQTGGGHTATHHLSCVRGGFDFCSEVRSLISAESYEAFEAPYLKRIGERLGPYAIHSCGSWERTIPSALRDANLRAMNGQSKENDVPTLCRLADGKILLSIAASSNVHTRYLWPKGEQFIQHLLEVVPDTQPFEIRCSEKFIEPHWLKWHKAIKSRDFELLPPLRRNISGR